MLTSQGSLNVQGVIMSEDTVTLNRFHFHKFQGLCNENIMKTLLRRDVNN